MQSDSCLEVPVLTLAVVFYHYEFLKDTSIFSLPSVLHLLSQILQKFIWCYSGSVALQRWRSSTPLIGSAQQQKKSQQDLTLKILPYPRCRVGHAKIMVQPKYNFFPRIPNERSTR